MVNCGVIKFTSSVDHTCFSTRSTLYETNRAMTCNRGDLGQLHHLNFTKTCQHKV